MEIQCFIAETKFTDKAIGSVVQIIYCALFNCNLFLVLLFRLVSMRECYQSHIKCKAASTQEVSSNNVTTKEKC